MKTLLLEPFSGISGDMLNGLLIDLGGDAAALKKELSRLPVKDYTITNERISKNSIYGVNFDVHLSNGIKDFGIPHSFSKQSIKESKQGNEEARNLENILRIIDRSTLSEGVKKHSRNVFLDIAKAESAVHNQSMEKIHFHEVGATDSIVDIVSFFILWEQLDIKEVYSTPIIDGSGSVPTAHGLMPVPVPAVMKLREGTNLIIKQDFEVLTELVTPTGLAIFKEINPFFSQLDMQKIEKVGYGFGNRNTGKFNALRGSLITTEYSKKEIHFIDEKIIKIEANIDDQTPEQLGFVMNFLFDKGALEVFHTSVQMKKNRMAILLTVLCNESDLDKFSELLFKETTTIGLRYTIMNRKVMKRKFERKTTPFGEIQIKKNTYKNIKKNTLEFEDCKRIAEEYRIPIYEVYETLEKKI